MTTLSRQISFLLTALCVVSVCCTQAIENNMTASQVTKKNQQERFTLSLFEQQIAAKMVLDMRYFCEDEAKQSVKKNCRKAVTELPEPLSHLITDSNIGGIVLFAENVIETEQVVKLTHAIQTAALKSSSAKPIIIAIDQEGGRVARFAKMTGFAGNMAIGATYTQYGTYFSQQANAVLGKELKVLGINNNYAPVVDVNTNAKNPVINTRSYGENAQQVAKLGVAAVDALQAQRVMATLKHFPGHGDTHVDSHIGLPKVEHDIATIEAVDLAPFSLAIEKTKPAMIMTAHIQYPVLDNSTFTSKSGEQLIRPATMSRKILTDLLRNKMSFDGIIATDALDMAGISHYFTDVEAVVETFIAGADLAVMPFKVRKPSDISAFHTFIKNVAKSLNARLEQADSAYSLTEFEQSLARLERYKNRYVHLPEMTLAEQIKLAKSVVAKAEHLNVEQNLANSAVTVLQGDITQLIKRVEEALSTDTQQIHLVVANQQEFSALSHAINIAFAEIAKQELDTQTKQKMPKVSYFIAESDFKKSASDTLIKQADLVIATIDVKTASLVDIGGMDDLASVNTRVYGSEAAKKQKHSYGQLLKAKLASATKQKIASVLIAKGSPYLLNDYKALVDVILLNFDDRIYSKRDDVEHKNSDELLVSPGFNAAIGTIFSLQTGQGVLPVTLADK